jgi:hypothetical protein
MACVWLLTDYVSASCCGKNIPQDKAKVEKDLKKNVPQFAGVAGKDFQYAFKIRVSRKRGCVDWR